MSERTIPSLDEIAAALDSSEAEIKAGRVVSADMVDRMIQERISRLEADQSAERTHRIPSRR